VIGRIETVREQVYAITNERKLTHPIVAAICRTAQHDMFGKPSPAPKRKG